MIAVIADDFTGAAELAGIGLRYGFSVQLFPGDIGNANAELVVASTDSRSMGNTGAIAATQQVLQALLQLDPAIIYKKTDSVLRGYVLDELKQQMLLQQKQKVLYLPANPSLQRTIVHGKYFIAGEAISSTGFASDPEFSMGSSLVVDMLRSNGEVYVLKQEDALPGEGIVVGEVSSKADIHQWLDKIDDSFLLAGAGDAFECLLEKMGHQQTRAMPLQLQQPHLYISGTSFNKSVEWIKEVAMQQHCVRYLSMAIMSGESDEAWFQSAIAIVQQHQKIIIAIDDVLAKQTNATALTLRTAMAKAVQQLVLQTGIREIFIEGGSTASAILNQLMLHAFVPVHETGRGVTRMKAVDQDLFITVKPGSYGLPSIIQRLYKP